MSKVNESKTPKSAVPVEGANSVPALGTQSVNIIPWRQLVGFISNPDSISPKTYEVMRKTDETVKAVVKFLTLAVTNKIDNYTHPDEKIRDFVRMNFEQMQGSLKGLVRQMCQSFWSGNSATEIVWRAVGNNVASEGPDGASYMLKSTHTLKPGTYRYVMDLDKDSPTYGQVNAVVQNPFTSWEVVIPSEKLILYAHEGENDNPYGNSMLKPMYKNWWFKDVLLKAYARTLERYGSPFIRGQAKSLCKEVEDQDGNKTTRGNAFLELLKDMHENAVIVHEPDLEIFIEQIGRSVGGDFLGALEYFNRMIMRAANIPNLLLDNSNTGSRSLGDTQMEILAFVLDELIEGLSDSLVDQCVKWIIWYNFGPQETWGQFANTAVKVDDLKSWAEIVEKLYKVNVLDFASDTGDLNTVRCKFGLEEKDQPIEEKNPTSKLHHIERNDVDNEGDGTEVNDNPDNTASLFAEEVRAHIIEGLERG